MQQQTPADEWASVNLTTDVEIKLRSDRGRSKILVGIACSFIGICLLVPPIWILVVSVTRSSSGNTNKDQSIGFAVVLLFVVLIGIISIIFVIWNSRRRMVRCMASHGVVTRKGSLHLWMDLTRIEFLPVYVRRPQSIEGVIQTAMFDGHERVKCRLVFSDGFAIVPPLIHDQHRILSLIKSIPVEQKWR